MVVTAMFFDSTVDRGGLTAELDPTCLVEPNPLAEVVVIWLAEISGTRIGLVNFRRMSIESAAMQRELADV